MNVIIAHFLFLVNKVRQKTKKNKKHNKTKRKTVQPLKYAWES